MSESFKRYRIGESVGDGVTVVQVIADVRGRHPIYLAWDHRAWCPVVVKIFRNMRKAQQEHDILAKLAHPNIVRSLGVQAPAAVLLEHLDGPTLRGFAARQPKKRLSVSDAMRACVHVGSALEQVHRAGFMHLDVKPGNVIVTDGRPVLFDFGTARLIIGQKRSPVVQGTDAYMSPEECALEFVSPASDVFSLGLTLFELLTGELPYPAPTRAEPRPQLLHKACDLRELRPGLPKDLAALVALCLERNPESRPRLVELLPALNCFIRSGAKMWPASLKLEPASRTMARAA